MSATFAPYQYATRCSGRATSGARALMKAALDRYSSARSLGIYSCLAGETLVMTPDGDVPIRDLAGTSATVLTWTKGERQSPRWVQAPIRSYGVQPLVEVVLQRGVDRQVIHATPEHRWITRYRRSGNDGGGVGYAERITSQLAPGHTIPSIFGRSGASRVRHFSAGVPHGLVYGDGTIDNTGGSRIALFGAKNMALIKYFPNEVSSIGQRPQDAEPYAVITGMSRTWKSLPSPAESAAYLYGFLAGWFAADGRVGASGGAMLYSANRESLEQARLLARRVGLGTYPVRAGKSGGNDCAGQWIEPGVMYSLSFVGAHLDSTFFLIDKHRERWNAARRVAPMAWTVVSVSPTSRVEDVYCAEVPGSENFVLAENVLTGNCRAVRGGGARSIHSEGRACDIGFPVRGGKAHADGHKLVRELLPVAGKLGIQALIFDRRIYSAKSPKGRRYTGVNPHVDHIHVELTRTAAAKLTVATIKAHLGAKAKAGVDLARRTLGSRVLRRGSSGTDVVELQKVVGAKPADGSFGRGTEAAVRAWQAKNDLSVDGVAGPRTLAKVLGAEK